MLGWVGLHQFLGKLTAIPPASTSPPVDHLSIVPPRERVLPTATASIPHFAIALDIDGVLLDEDKPLPGAVKCLRYLLANRIPFILLSNRAGETEAAHLKRLEDLFSLNLPAHVYVQSHTPCQTLLAQYRHQTVLVIGGKGNACREIAQGYGFRDCLTVADLVVSFPHLSRYSVLAEHFPPSQCRRLAAIPRIAAVFFFENSRDWCLDIQIAVDLALSHHGRLGTVSPLNGCAALPNHGYQQDGQPTFYFSNADLAWARADQPSKLGQGAFAHALRAVWHAATDGRADFRATVLGKPSYETFAFGERVIRLNRQFLIVAQKDASPSVPPPLSTVYMIGDNPASDIRGANEYRSAWATEWKSVLVETGLHVAGDEPKYKPTFVAKGVEEAVERRCGVKVPRVPFRAMGVICSAF